MLTLLFFSVNAIVDRIYRISHYLQQIIVNKALSQALQRSQRRIRSNSYEELSISIKSLIVEGAELNKKDRHGFTPLHRATFYDSLITVKALLQAGADVYAQDRHGRTPLHFLWSREIGEQLLERSANLHAKDTLGRTPLHLVKSNAAATFLLEKGADILAKDVHGEIPLTVSIKNIPSPARLLFPYFYDFFNVLIAEINESLALTKTLSKATLLENPDETKPALFNDIANDNGRMSTYWDSHLTEIHHMMDEKIPGGYASFYSFFKEKNLNKLIQTMTKNNINSFEQLPLSEKFPNFFIELQTQLKAVITLSKERDKWLSLARKCDISSNDSKKIRLNYDNFLALSTYLTNKDIHHTLKASLATAAQCDPATATQARHLCKRPSP
jgi:hypothetical protein